MKKSLLSPFFFLAISLAGFSQPYGGTIFIEPAIITAADSSALENVTYTGRGFRTVFDRRVNNWTTINAFLFEVAWNDGLTSEAVVNPEFVTIDLAKVEAEKYGWHIGQLPKCLRTDVDEIWIHKGVQLFGGGNQSILIHTGQSANYENDGILEETLVHEASHTSLDAMHAHASGWITAQNLDGQFISDYAKEFPAREDIAESFLLWLAVRYRESRISTANYNTIRQTIPNRLNYFDSMDCDLSPFYTETPTSIADYHAGQGGNIIFPNPSTHFFFLQHLPAESCQATIVSLDGKVVFTGEVSSRRANELPDLPAGLYLLTLQTKGEFIRQKLIIK